MGLLDNMMLHFDEGVTGVLGEWNVYTTGLATLLALIVSYRIVASHDPDIHPMLLARQAQPSPVRQEGESPVYRSQFAPHGTPLSTGLSVKDPGVSKWARGRDGDLRDVWRRATTGVPNEQGGPPGAKGRILTVLGREQVIEHNLDELTRQINLIGQHIHQHGGIRVAIYLPNSVELITTLFACSFYQNLTAILIPFDISADELISMLRRSAADTIITATGSFPFDSVVKSYPSLRNVIWVVDEGNRHMDWNEVPQGLGGSVNVATWQDILQDQPVTYGTELPPADIEFPPKDVIGFWQSRPGQMEEMVRFTQANIVSGIAAQLAAIPIAEALGPADLFIPGDSLTNVHTLVLTLAALFSNASVAFNSVAGAAPDLALATQGVAPTVVVAAPATLLKTHAEAMGRVTSGLARLSHWLQSRSLVQDGIMPAASLFASLADSLRAAPSPVAPGKLRLVFAADRAGTGTPPLSSGALSDLRVLLGARVVYALAAARVAGAAAQTGFYDYRVTDADGARASHFGPPTTSTEILLRDTPTLKSKDGEYVGKVIVRGPCVAGGEADIGVVGRIGPDNTLSYA